MHTGRRIQLPVERLRQMSGERKRELCRVQLGAGGPFERRGKKLGKKFEVCKTLNSTLNLFTFFPINIQSDQEVPAQSDQLYETGE